MNPIPNIKVAWSCENISRAEMLYEYDITTTNSKVVAIFLDTVETEDGFKKKTMVLKLASFIYRGKGIVKHAV